MHYNVRNNALQIFHHNLTFPGHLIHRGQGTQSHPSQAAPSAGHQAFAYPCHLLVQTKQYQHREGRTVDSSRQLRPNQVASFQW